MASGTIVIPGIYELGTWTVVNDKNDTLSNNNKIYRIGNMGAVKIVITKFATLAGSERHTLYSNISFRPIESQSFDVMLKTSSGSLQTGCINVNTDGTVTFVADGAFANTIVRKQIFFPIAP